MTVNAVESRAEVEIAADAEEGLVMPTNISEAIRECFWRFADFRASREGHIEA